MELHYHFINVAGLESSIFEAVENDSIIQDSISVILTKTLEENYNKLKTNVTKELLQLQRRLLCVYYKKNYNRCITSTKRHRNVKFCELVELFTCEQLHNNTENLSILLDILILNFILFEDQKDFIHSFEDIRTCSTIHSQKQTVSKLSVDCYLKLVKCFLAIWELLYFLNNEQNLNIINQAHLQSCKKVLISSILYDLQTWIKLDRTDDWHALHPVLSKIISIDKDTKILTPYIQEVFNKGNLTIICVLCDFIFPKDSSDIDIEYSLVLNKSLWLLIQDKLISNKSPERKYGLHLFKRLAEFIDINEDEIKKCTAFKLTEHNIINPFICCQNSPEKQLIKQVRTDFILIFESLEEKQKHLVIPSLSLVDNLIKGFLKHESCGNCINLSWIYCIFLRILSHDNSSIIHWGLIKLLTLNIKTYDCDSFLLLTVKTLNNTFLYEKNSTANEPEVSLALTDWFINSHHSNPNLIKKFVCFLTQVSWAPVPIFYILNSLVCASEKLTNISTWEQEQLDAIRCLVENSIKLHPLILSSSCQVLLLRIVSKFCDTKNLMAVSNLLLAFSEKDIKEKSCWSALTLWVSQVQFDIVLDYVRKICHDLRVNDACVKMSMSVFSTVIQLLYEAKVICQKTQCDVTQELSTLFLNLEKIEIRPYVQVSFVIKIIDLMHNLINSQYPPAECILQFHAKYKEAILKFCLKLVHYDKLSYEEIQTCVKIITCTDENSKNKTKITPMLTNSSNKYVETKCLEIITDTNKHNKMQLLFALQLWSSISHHYKYEDELFYNIVMNLLKIASSKNDKHKLTGKVSLDYYMALSKLIRNHIATMNASDLKKNDKWLNVVSSILDASGNQVLIYFGDILHFYSAAFTDDNEKQACLKTMINNFSKFNFASKREKVFWLVAQKLTTSINSSNILDNKYLQDVSDEFNNRMLSEGDVLQGLKYILLTFSEMKKYFNHFMGVLLNGLLHGQVLRRDQRIYMQACLLSSDLLTPYKFRNECIQNFEAHTFISRQYNIDAAVRAAAVLQLKASLNDCNENASLFLPLVVEKLLTVQKKRYFADSQLHRLKHRIFQILLILQPYLKKDSIQILYQILCNSVIQDTDQHSIRMMREWLLIRIYLSDENLLSDLWLFFDKVYIERPGCINSVIGIVWHIAQKLEKKNLIEFIDTALAKLGICCLGQQFGMRLFGQIFFVKLYELLEENCDVKTKYLSFYQATLESLNNGHVKKNHLNVNEDFFYTVFDPLKHYTLETIYHQLPRLSNISFEELIPKEHFEGALLDDIMDDLKLSNCDNLLVEAEVPVSVTKSNDHQKSEEIDIFQSITPTADIQKKISPLKTLLPNQEELEDITNLKNLKISTENNAEILVVASLVEKPQNLGGIARTCEIFGVKELVISNCKEVEEKSFQALSVSADKWIKITEVKPFLLTKYLLELKNSGWTLIGAEQTVNSVNLLEFKFPNRIALILGNEKNGIPANIIPLLDTCVEISQFGVIRSLNVHVTTAICVWEYIKQHIVN